jgi:hypothetical protein
MTILMILNVVAGLVLAGLSVPLIWRKIGPNPLYGFRVARTLGNPDTWYAVNAFAAWRLLWVGLGTSVVAVVLYWIPGIDLVAYSLSCAALFCAGLFVILVQSFRYLNTLPQ